MQEPRHGGPVRGGSSRLIELRQSGQGTGASFISSSILLGFVQFFTQSALSTTCGAGNQSCWASPVQYTARQAFNTHWGRYAVSNRWHRQIWAGTLNMHPYGHALTCGIGRPHFMGFGITTDGNALTERVIGCEKRR
ncbi:hypothetical protein BD410DRAFT_791484 [Rickenella mellea]|uniref:Uncharacterized protein n=1 Tax=Rickenella mellea TaxID=50990 RepID=A0A4Y7PYL3_9AGAM|nr:hypothetical protein BD410DRAFT_791484 [Rickenella mellea]